MKVITAVIKVAMPDTASDEELHDAVANMLAAEQPMTLAQEATEHEIETIELPDPKKDDEEDLMKWYIKAHHTLRALLRRE